LRLPETPRYMVMKGHYDEAAELLKRINGTQNPQDKVRQIRESIGNETSPKLSDLLGRTFGLKKVVWIGVLVALSQQFCGVNVILYYDSGLWRSVSSRNSRRLTSPCPHVRSVHSDGHLHGSHRPYRTPSLLAFGSAGMAIFLFVAAFGFAHATMDASGLHLNDAWAPITLIAVYLFYLTFYGTEARHVGRAWKASRTASVPWVWRWLPHSTGSATIVSTSFPSTAHGVGLSGAYLMYGVFAAISFLFVTKGLQDRWRSARRHEGGMTCSTTL
ncbi:MAG: MFS transporter, partial [Varibaculum sp.]